MLDRRECVKTCETQCAPVLFIISDQIVGQNYFVTVLQMNLSFGTISDFADDSFPFRTKSQWALQRSIA